MFKITSTVTMRHVMSVKRDVARIH